MLRTTSLCLVLLTFTLTPVQAAELSPNTTLIGAGIWSRPAYTGAESNRLSAIPTIRYYGQPWFMRTTFGMLEGGARTEVLSGLTLGGQFAYEDSRNSSESNFLATHNIPTLNAGLSWGVHVELEKNLGPMPIIALLRYRQNIENNRGAQTDLRLTVGIFDGGGLKAGIFAQTTWADKNAANTYYGISTALAASSGLATFEAQSGEMFNAYGLLWSYDLNPQWMLLGSVESRRVQGAVSNSPLVQQSSNQYGSLGFAYQF